MKVKIDRSNPLRPLVHFYVDEGSHSCGESRTDYRKVNTCTLEDFLRGAEALGSGAKTEAYL